MRLCREILGGMLIPLSKFVTKLWSSVAMNVELNTCIVLGIWIMQPIMLYKQKTKSWSQTQSTWNPVTLRRKCNRLSMLCRAAQRVGHSEMDKHLQVAEETCDQKGWCWEAYKPSVWSKEGSLILHTAGNGSPGREGLQEAAGQAP